MHDWLGLGAEAHLNTPGKLGATGHGVRQGWLYTESPCRTDQSRVRRVPLPKQTFKRERISNLTEL